VVSLVAQIKTRGASVALRSGAALPTIVARLTQRERSDDFMSGIDILKFNRLCKLGELRDEIALPERFDQARQVGRDTVDVCIA